MIIKNCDNPCMDLVDMDKMSADPTDNQEIDSTVA